MFIPSKKFIESLTESQIKQTEKVYLKNMHLIVAQDVVDDVFPETDFVYLSYKADIKRLFMASFKDEVFRKLHEPAMQMLKQRGDLKEKSIALHEILIDNDLATEDRTVEYEIRQNRKMLVIQF